MSNANTRVVVVTGLMRSGTSCLMQCLQSAGIECLGNAPGYEDKRTVDEGMLPTELMLDAQGRAVKVLEPHCRFLPSGFEYVVISTERDKMQQAKSYFKMLKKMGETTKMSNKKAIRRLRDMIHSHQKQADSVLRTMKVLHFRVKFEDLIGYPRKTLEPIAEALGLDADLMASPIIERPVECLNGLIELDLIQGNAPTPR